MIKPEEIPQFTGDLDALERDCAALTKDAGHIRGTGSDVHSRFQGLSAYYKAPEPEQLFATTSGSVAGRRWGRRGRAWPSSPPVPP
ncbi:hypothetical protein GCM10010499_30980 [Streptomyces thermoviolaceus subsp. apingens]|nr:hypothetical protein GCM10010499_30980 [Streptomyces thermoviolaceus subsp. apingens]